MTPAAMYADTRRRVTELLEGLSPSELATVVPATPAWTVHEVAAHLAGVCHDVVAGRIEGAATDPWTERQVQARRGLALEEILQEWGAKAPQLEAMLDSIGPAGYRLVIDAVTHEQDIRGAVAKPGGRGTEAANWSLQQILGGLDRALRRAGVRPLRVVAGSDEWLIGGDAEPGATLTAGHYELLRALMGRRSSGQLARYPWTGDSSPYLDRLAVFPPAASDITE